MTIKCHSAEQQRRIILALESLGCTSSYGKQTRIEVLQGLHFKNDYCVAVNIKRGGGVHWMTWRDNKDSIDLSDNEVLLNYV